MTQEQTPALKACPLCHSTNVDSDRDDMGPLTVIWCLECGCNVDDCTISASDESPFDRWQARTPDPAVAGLVEALRACRKAVSNGREEPLYNVREIVDEALKTWNEQ